jgi:hypothetical protein
MPLAARSAHTRPDSDHLTLLRLCPSPIGNDQSARRLLIGINAFDQHTIVKGWTDIPHVADQTSPSLGRVRLP